MFAALKLRQFEKAPAKNGKIGYQWSWFLENT
jgi:hypothetical protein